MNIESSHKPEVVLIVAASKNRVIGRDNDLPWHLPVDMQFFKETTRGYPVIMGRKNYESIPHKFRPLPGRKNIVITRQNDYPTEDGVGVCHDLSSAIALASKEGKERIFVIGGGQIYALALEEKMIDRMLITWVDTEIEGHAFFPEFSAKDWQSQTLMHHPADERHDYAMEMVEYVKN